MSGELLSPLIERLLNFGALDAHFQSITMKKGRQGQLCTVLCTENTLDAVTNCIFKHTSTFGFRMIRKERRILDRQFDIVQTERGPVNIKVGLLRNAVVQISVEFKDAQIIANQHDLSVQEVFQFSLAQHRHQFPHRYSKTEEA